MKKTILEGVEKILTSAILAFSCMGITLFGWFFCQLTLPDVTEEHLWNVFVVSVILTYAMQRLLTCVGMKIMEIEAEELELQKDEETKRLLEHLGVK